MLKEVITKRGVRILTFNEEVNSLIKSSAQFPIIQLRSYKSDKTYRMWIPANHSGRIF